jgi:limonene-1,2-epoxide hydrolase
LRSTAAIGLLALLLMAGCSGGKSAYSASPASVVRAWSKALNAGDNEAAANLFARGARVIQGGEVIRLRSHSDAVQFNQALPCSGHVLSVTVIGNVATATFLLGDRTTSRCDGPGQKARAEFQVKKGKIVLWRQLPSLQPAPSTAV